MHKLFNLYFQNSSFYIFDPLTLASSSEASVSKHVLCYIFDLSSNK
jgi:hypothetical protein